MILSAEQAREMGKNLNPHMERIKEAIRWHCRTVTLINPLAQKDVDFLISLGYDVKQPDGMGRGHIKW